jgi:hypothetical protein
MKSIPFKIPCKPHIKAFLEFHFGAEYVLSTSDFLGIIVFHFLKKQSNYHQKTNKTTNFDKIYSSYYAVRVPEHYVFNNGVADISVITVVHFNVLMEKFLSFYFKGFVNKKMEPPPKYQKDAILEFMDDNGITEESITEDAFLRSYQRYKKQMYRLKLGK